MKRHLPDERLVFLDLEVGGEQSWRPIFEIACVAVDAELRELETYCARLKFSKKLACPTVLRGSRYASAVWNHEAVSSIEAGDRLVEFLRRHATVDQTTASGRVVQVAQIVAHNAAFDGRYLQHWFKRRNQFLPASPRILCTMQRAIWLFHENKSMTPPLDFKLPTLCQYFGIRFESTEAHHALDDVRATVQLYREMNQFFGRYAAGHGPSLSAEHFPLRTPLRS